MRARVLLVDDYRDALDMWAVYLRTRGFDTLTASDGPSAVRIATETVPDLIVMDLVLPGINGCEAARLLRAQPVTAHIPIIATTGNTNPRELAVAAHVGFAAIVIKPCDPPALVGEIVRALAERAAETGGADTGQIDHPRPS